MYSLHLYLILAILYLGFAKAELFVVQPLEGSTCQANKPCTITWVDNGVSPLLSAVGVSTVGLYTGHEQLVQTIDPVDVSTGHSVTFNPNPSAGPNADTYYIAITSTTLKVNDSIPYSGWSSFFTLTGMTGSFDAPLASATSSIPIPSTLSTSDGVGTSTRTIDAVSTAPVAQTASSRPITSSRPAPSASSRSSSQSRLPSSSGFATSSSSATQTTSTSTSTSATSTAPVTTGTSAAAVTTPAASSASTGSASRSILVLTVVASIIYSTLS